MISRISVLFSFFLIILFIAAPAAAATPKDSLKEFSNNELSFFYPKNFKYEKAQLKGTPPVHQAIDKRTDFTVGVSVWPTEDGEVNAKSLKFALDTMMTNFKKQGSLYY